MLKKIILEEITKVLQEEDKSKKTSGEHARDLDHKMRQNDEAYKIVSRVKKEIELPKNWNRSDSTAKQLARYKEGLGNSKHKEDLKKLSNMFDVSVEQVKDAIAHSVH